MKMFSRLLLIAVLFIANIASADYTISGNGSFAGSVGVQMPITDIQIAGSGTEPIPVKLLVTNGTLSMTATSGLTFTGGSTGSALYFSGTQANLNAALATLRYLRGGVGSDTLEVSLVPQGEVFFTDNGHLYEYVSGTMDWNAARTAAAARTKYGATGYLATITSAAENAFVTARLSNGGWMGASDSAVEGVWRWVTGPESISGSSQFWNGGIGGSVTAPYNYAAWNGSEPNDSGSNEDCAQYLSGGSGMWNDLPCSGTTQPGYVVEYGGTTTPSLPTVVGRNVSITTTAAPTISIITPADNATNITTSADLVIQFSAAMYPSTGNITIRKSSDDSIFETIDVASTTQVTGSSTNTITLNPNGTLAEGTGYYVLIPNTAFRNVSSTFFGGISATTTWNFTTGDFTAPSLVDVTATSTASTSSTIIWTTVEDSSTRLWHGLTSAVSTSTTETDTSPRASSHSVALTGLIPCTTYFYQAVSRDAALNTSSSSINSFTTTGCIASSTPTSATSTTIDTSSSGTSTLTTASSTFTVNTTPAVYASSSSFVIQIRALPDTDVLAAIGTPSGVNQVGDIVFDVKAIVGTSTVLDSFDAPVTITYQYTEDDINGLNEASLWLYHYANGAWSALDNCVLDTDANVITCTAPHFSIFSLFGSVPAAASTNRASVGPMGGGGSVQEQVSYLSQMGKNAEAENLKKQWPNLFAVAPTTVAKSGPMVLSRNLQKGMSGADVGNLQGILIKLNLGSAAQKLKSVGVTGYFGAVTQAAVVEFQIKNKITPAKGYFGPVTRKAIEKVW